MLLYILLSTGAYLTGACLVFLQLVKNQKEEQAEYEKALNAHFSHHSPSHPGRRPTVWTPTQNAMLAFAGWWGILFAWIVMFIFAIVVALFSAIEDGIQAASEKFDSLFED
jgi:hypothetical protein